MPTQKYTIGHDAGTLGSSAVSREQNQISPQRETPVLRLTVPDNFDEIEYVGPRDSVNFEPRTKETFSGDGSTTTFSLTADILPIAGEPLLADQPYPAVQAAVGGSEVAIASIDYAANEVTLESAPATGTDNVQLFPIMTEGTLKFQGVNTLDQIQGPVYPWTHPIYRWADVDQDKRGTEVQLPWPSFTWERNETLDVMLDSPRQIVWEDADYPFGSYVSTFELDVMISF